MGILGQAWLLLWKNVKLRQRRPILTIAQIAWPLLIFVIIAILRTSFPARDVSECQYNARALPSSGVLPFMQSMVCDLESPCLKDPVPNNQVPTLADAQLGQVLEDLTPIFQNESIIDSVKALPKTLAPITGFVEVIEDTLQSLKDDQPQVADFFQNVTQLQSDLQDAGLPPEAIDAILSATVDTLEVLDLVGSANISQVCNETFLQELLIFPPEANVTVVSAALCNLTNEELVELVDILLDGLDTLYITDEIQKFLDGIKPYTLEDFIEDIQAIRDKLENSGDLQDLIESLPQLIQLTKLAPVIEFLIEEISKDLTDRFFEELVSIIVRIDGYLENIPWWQKFEEIVSYVLEVVDIIRNTEGDTKDKGIELFSFIQNSTSLLEQLNVTNEVLEMLLQSEIRPEQIQLFLELLENPEEAASVICSGNITQVITLPPDVDTDAATMLLCSFNVSKFFAMLRDEIDPATLLDEFMKLLEQGSGSGNQTVDWEDVLNRTFQLIEELNQIGEKPALEIVTEVLETFTNLTSLDTSTLEKWLGLFISVNATSGPAKNESGPIIDVWLDPLVTLLQAELAQTPLWFHIQKQLIVQNLALDLQLLLLDTFASGSCPDKWHSYTPSCYQYNYDEVDYATSQEFCHSLHGSAHPVTVNHEKEQDFLEKIGEDQETWIGLYQERSSYFWLDGTEVTYNNWGSFEGSTECAVANFGQDGLWYSLPCVQTAGSLCEAPQEHALVTLIKNSPVSDLSELMLQIGPNATEVLLRQILDPTTIEMLTSSYANVTFELCSESFLDAVGSDLPDDILAQICAWDVDAFWESQMEYWKFPEIKEKLLELFEISSTEPEYISESYYPLADFEAIIAKQNVLAETITAAAMIPLDLEQLLTSLQPDIEVTGTPEEWQAVAERLNEYWYQQQLQQLADQLAQLGNNTGLLEAFIVDFQQQLAIQEVANLIVEGGNTLFEIIEDLSEGIIGVSEPETQKLLTGIKKLLESSARIQTAIGEALGNPEKSYLFFYAMAQENFFCNRTLRDSVLDLKDEEKQIFDEYICAVDYPVLFMEFGALLDVPEIQKLIRFYIPYNSSADLLPFPDPVATQEIWAEYVNYLININEIRSQYIDTYNLTKMEVVFAVPDFANLSSPLNLLDMLESILTAYDINVDALKVVRFVIEDLLAPGGHNDISVEDILQELSPLLNSSDINLKELEQLASVIENLLQNNISSDLSLSQILDQLASLINATELNFEALRFLEVIVSNVLSFDNNTEMSLLAIFDELKPLLEEAGIDLDGLKVIRTVIENFGSASGNPEFSFMDLLEELQPYLNGSDINTDALKVLDVIISHLVPLENITDERIKDLVEQLEPYFNMSGINPEWTDAIEEALINVTMSLENATTTDILLLLRALRPFLSSDINLDGLKVIEAIIKSINSLATETDPNRYFEIIGEIFSMFENSTWVEAMLQDLFISDLFTVALRDIFTQSTGKVYTFPDDLGSHTDPDDIEQLIPVIYRSVDIIQVLFGLSLDQEKITQLATSPDIIQNFCPNGSLEFFNTSFAEGVDLVSLQHDLCAIDLDAVITEVISYPPLSMLVTELPNLLHQSPLPSFNWTAYFIHSEQLDQAITEFILDPPEIKVNPIWLNTTKTDLLQVLIDAGSSQNEAMMMQQLESLQTFLYALHEISPAVTWVRQIEDAVRILLGSISYSNDILETLPGQNITFDDILPPYLAEHFTKSLEYSGDINGLFLHAAINIEELIAMSETGDIFSVICANISTLRMLLDLPPEVNITAAHQIICSLNETAVSVEVMREVQKIVDKAQLDQAIDVMKATEVVEEFIKNVINLKESPPNFSQFDDAWMEMTSEKWEAIIKSLEMAQMIPTSLDDLGLEMLFQMLQEILKDDPGFQFWLIQLRIEDYFTVLIIEQAKDLVGKNISFQELNKFLRDYPSLQDVLSLREVIPEIVDILLALSTDPAKIQQFWNSSMPFQTVCMAGTFSYFFEVPVNSSTNLTSLESRLCGLNKTALFSEVDSLLGISEIQSEITKILTLDPSLPPLNFTAALFLRDLESQLVFTELFENPPTVYVDEEFWKDTREELQRVFSLWEEDLDKLLMPSNPLMDLSSLAELIEAQLMPFENETWYEQVLEQMRLMDYVNELIIEWATDFQGKELTLPSLDELFQNSSNIKELLQLTELTSDLIDAFLSLSLTPEKWTEFLTIENPIATLCSSGEFTNFFQLPEDSISNITAVANAVCSVNLTAVDIELNEFLGLNEIGAEVSQILYNSASLGPYNWTASLILSMQVQNALQGLIENPPVISVDPVWWNQTQLEIKHVVEQWLKRVEETSVFSPAVPDVMDIINALWAELDGFKNESWYQDIVQQMRINDLVNKLLISVATELQGKTLTLPTLGELFQNSSHIRELLEISAVAPDIIDAFLTLSLQPDKWESFWAMTDPIPTLCASGNFTSFFRLLPDSTSDITAVEEAVCSLNLTAVEKEFSDLIQLDEVSSQLAAILYNHPSLGPYNWTASYILSRRTNEAIADLILDPPVITVDPVWWNQTVTDLKVVVAQWTSYLMEMTPGTVSNTSTEWLPDVISSLEEQLSAFRNESWYQDLITQMRVMDLVNRLIIEWVTQFQGQTLTLPTLEELFENSTHVRQLLELTNLTPDLLDVFLNFSVQEEKWEAFLTMDEPIATLCASGNFTTFFQLPPDSPSNITTVAEAVCAVNITAVDRELRYLFNVDSISSELSLILYNHPSLGPYNWTASFQLSQDVQQAIQDLVVNPPVFLVDPIWLNQTQTDLGVVIQQWWTRLVEMSGSSEMNGFAVFIEMLESQLSAFQDEEWYKDLITQMRLMDEVNRIIAQWINGLSGATITVPHFNELFQNTTYIKELLELQNLTPELIDVFMSLSVDPEKWETFWSMDAPIANLCTSGNFSAFFVLPPDSMTDLMAVEAAVCSINVTAIDKELTELFGLDETFAKIALILANDPSLGPYNWTASYLLSMQLQKAIEEFIVNPVIIEIDGDFWNGTRSRLLDVLQEWGQHLGGIVTPSNPSGGMDINSIVEMIIGSLSPLFENSEWYQGVIQYQRIMDEVNKIIIHWAEELNGQTIILPYLDSLFENATHVREILALQKLTPEFIELFMSLSMKPEKFAEFFLTDKPFGALCMNSTFAEYFDLPSESKVNITELQTAVCSINLSAAEDELSYFLQLDSFAFKLMQILANASSLGPYNRTASVILSQQVQEAIAQLITGPPVFKVDTQWLNNTLSALKHAYELQMARLREMFGQTDSQLSLKNGLEQIEMFLNQTGIWDKVQPVLEAVTVSLDLYVTQAERNVNDLKVYLNVTIPPGVAADLTSPSADELKAYIISNFIPVTTLAYFHNNDLWDVVFCDETVFKQYVYIAFEEVINATALRLLLCETNSTQLFQDLEGYYGFDIVKIQEEFTRIFSGSPVNSDFDWQELIDLTQELTALFEEIQKLPEIMHGSMNVSGIQGRLIALQTAIFEQNVETVITLLYELGPIFDLKGVDFNIRDLLDSIHQQMEAIENWTGMMSSWNNTETTVLELLQMIESSLMESGVWNQIRPVIEITNLLLTGANEWLYPQGLTPSQVFFNDTTLTEILTSQISGLNPTLMETKAITDFIPLLKLASIYNSGLWEETWQCANYSEGGPDFGDYTNVIEMLCTLNATEFFEDVSDLLKVNVLELERQLSSLEYASSGSNMTTIPVDWEELINNVQLFATAQRELLSVLTSMSNAGSSSSFFDVIWQLIGNMDENPMLIQIFQQLDNALLKNPMWLEVKGYIVAVTEIVESVNAEFLEVRDNGFNGTTFFEVQTDLMELIQEIFSQNELEALLQATVNEEMLENINNFKDVADIICDEDQFNLLLTFPSTTEVDVGVIQRSLCDLIKSSNVTIQLGLYHYLRLGTIYQQVMRLYTYNNYTDFPTTEVDLMMTLAELNLLVENLMSVDGTKVWHVLMELGTGGDMLDGFPMVPIMTNMTFSPTSVCEMVQPYVSPWLPGLTKTILVKSDLFMQVVNQLYFDLPNHEEEIQSLLNNQTLVGELLWATFSVSSEALMALQGLSKDMGQIYILRALFLDVIEGNLHHVACSEEDLRNLLSTVPTENISELSTLICSLDTIIQTQLVQELLVIIDFESAAEKIRVIDGSAVGKLPPFSCSSFFENGEEFANNLVYLLKEPMAFKLELEIPGLVDLMEDISSIVTNLTSGDTSSLLTLVDLLDELVEQDFLGENGTARLVINELLQLYDRYIGALKKDPGVIPVDSVWFNSSEVVSLLLKETQLTEDDVTSLMEGSINATVIAEIANLTLLNWGKLVCYEDVFMRLLILSSEELETLLYQETCQHPNKEMLFEEIYKRFNLFKFLVETSQSAIPVPTFLEFLEGMLANIENLEKLNATALEDIITNVVPLLEDANDISSLINIIPSLENLTLALDSFDELLENLEPVFGDAPELLEAKSLLELIKENEYIIDVLREFPDLSVEKMLRDPDAVRFFLEEEIGLSSEMVDTIFNAQINPGIFLKGNITNELDSICSEETFQKYLDFVQDTDLAVAVDGICSQEISTVGELLGHLFTSFDTDGIFDAFSSSGLIEAVTNMTDSFQNLTQSLGEIQELQDTIPTVIESAQSLEKLFDEEVLDELARGDLDAFTLLQENSDLFCDNGGSFRRKRRIRRQTLVSPSASKGFCQDLYSSLQSGNLGEVQWTFIKPILLGKILYTPISPASDNIIKKANKPFEDLTEISAVAQSWLRGVTELNSLLDSSGLEEIENLLGNAYISQLLETELAIDADSLMTVLNGNLTTISSSTLNQITLLAELVVNMTSCIELDRFVGFETEAEMEEYAVSLNMDNLYLAGISFQNLEGAVDVPKHVKYALRMDTDKTPSTEFLTDLYWRPGPRNDFFTHQQYLQGFVFLQDMIERAVIELHANSDELSDVFIQQMPYPCHKNDRYLFVATVIFPMLFTIGFLILMAVMTHQLVYEKERGIEELMKVMGLASGVNWFAWFFANAILLSILMVAIAIILQAAIIIQTTQVSVLIVFLLCFAFSLIMQSYMVSSFFQKANIASLGAVLVYLTLFVPYLFILTEGGKVSVIGSLAVSLASPSAFSFGCLIISRFEHQGIGATWDNIWENPRDEGDDSTLAASCIMMVVDGFLYFIIGWYIRTVFPGKFGVPRPWYFPFQPSYWFRGIQSDTDHKSTRGGEVNEAYLEEGATQMTDMGAQVESEPSDAPVGIAIQNLSKVYGARCPSIENRALDKVTLNFFEGQVTALLGSNGAGKTTIISIITGLFPSSGGSVSIYNQQVGFSAGVRGRDLGLCPQHNALYDELTVREHLKIYGKLKGMSKKTAQKQAFGLLEELRLVDMINVPVRKLSGGMKRKLCVAISLMGNAKTVILDEPTSGVDPHARRAIWDLVIRSKKDRTIVLCTHFMDEADLLGDRIAILDRGELRCCGSSAFLKSKFTSGVKLTLSKERPSGSSTPQSPKKLSIEEGVRVTEGNDYTDLPVAAAKEAREEDDEERASSSSSSGVSSQRELCDAAKVTQFLTSRVEGITLLKEIGSELVYQLPSTSEEKAKFPQLFRDLDDQLKDLHIRNYGVSDTNLEQVFLKVSTHSDTFKESNVDRPEVITEDPSKRKKSQTIQTDEVMFGGQLTKAFQQFRGILLKRFHITRRDWRGFIWSVLMPVAMLALGALVIELVPGPVFPALQLTPAMFRDPNYVFFSNGQTSSISGERFTEALLSPPGIGTTCMADADEMDKYPCEFTQDFFPEPISSLTSEEKKAIEEEDLHSPLCVCEDGISVCDEGVGGVPPPEWITNTSAILQDLSLKKDVTEYLLNTRHLYQRNRYGGVTFVDIQDGDLNRTVIKAWYSNVGHHALPTYINVANNVLLRALLPAGSNPAQYGITAYNHPIELAEASPDVTGWRITSIQFGLLLFLMMALAMIPSTLSTLMVQENLNGAKHLHFVSGVTPARYWFTNLLWDMLVYIIPAGLIIIVLLIFRIEAFISDHNIGTFILLLLVYGFAIFPQCYLIVPLFRDTGTAFVMFFCSNVIIYLLTNLPNFLDYLQLANYQPNEALPVLNSIFLIFTPFCISSGLLTLLYNQLETDIYASFGVVRITRPLYMVRWNIIAMVIHTVVAMALILLLEYKKKKRVKCSPPAAGKSPYEQEDEDVEEERERVSSGAGAGDVISLQDITKVYSIGRRQITAVNHVSFGVPKGECFGLLGVNGAGKTTLFKTITSAIAPSDGRIHLNAKSIGYCPQVNAIYDQVTGEEILYCYARLKGLKEEYVKEVVDDIISKMGMGEFSKKVVSTYSGGMKRTLSVAVSLLGNPQLVLMDEPTAGMDPISKQAVWRGIQAAMMDGRSVIVTSHSMEECENLCTRLAIMVNGQFQCLGSPQHVKHRHGEGYTLILHLLSSDKSADLSSVASFMDAKFPESVLKEHHLTMLRYQLSPSGFSLADIYEAVEKERDALGIEEYSVTQTTLDQVFVNFAKKQTDGHDDDTSSISSLGIVNPVFDPESLNVL